MRSFLGSISVSVERNQSSTFFFFPSPFYLLLPFTFLLLPACLLFLLFNLLFFLKMRTYYYEFTVVCDMRPGKHSVTAIRSEALYS